MPKHSNMFSVTYEDPTQTVTKRGVFSPDYYDDAGGLQDPFLDLLCPRRLASAVHQMIRGIGRDTPRFWLSLMAEILTQSESWPLSETMPDDVVEIESQMWGAFKQIARAWDDRDEAFSEALDPARRHGKEEASDAAHAV